MVSVSILKIGERPVYYAQYRDEVTGKKVRRSTGEKTKRKAERFAAQWESEIKSGISAGCTWEHFRERFSLEHCITLRDSTARGYETILDCLEDFSKPLRLESVSADFISRWRVHLVKIGVSDSTRATYLRTLKAALNWAVSVGLLSAVPNFPKEKRKDSGKHRGRALTAEEVQLMIDAVPSVVSDSRASEAYQRLIRGLYLSGLRVGESQSLSWCDKSMILADIAGKYPMFRFPGAMQKNGKTQSVPMAPDFAKWLKETPKRERTGMVLAIPVSAEWTSDTAANVKAKRVSTVVAQIGKKTGISTGEASTPTAHDLRRSFASNWARRVLPQTLQTMMRHSSITTTMGFYVTSQADAIGAELASLDISDK